MYRFTIPFCIFLSLFSIKGFSQNGDYSWRLGIGGGLTNYYGDLSYQFISGKDYIRQFYTQSTPWMLSANLEKRISSSWGINLQAGWGYLVGNDRARDWDGNLLTENPDISRALNFRTEVKKADLLLAYHFDNDRILRRDAVISPYLFGGV
ncbi:MAG: hypothetical protein KDD99_03615, partial [Bacteroidetes bacterium]|nr:hypothetical protein [Bacteroidota bacterium]